MVNIFYVFMYKKFVKPLKHRGNYMYHLPQHLNLCILLTHCVIRAIKNYYLPEQY
jgi:hypothetical protein